MILLACGVLLGAYLLGSVPFGVLLARRRGVDLRQIGSGNIGATNAARALGRRLGVVVFLCDGLKGFVPAYAAYHAPGGGAALSAMAGLAAFAGHLAPPWLRFRGGKGVATGFGVLFAWAPLPALVGATLFVAAYLAGRMSSLGSLLGATVAVGLAEASGLPISLRVAASLMWLAVVWRHRDNVARLLRGEESKV